MTIENYTGDLAGIDNTFGYNDWLLVATGNASMATSLIDDLSSSTQRARLSGTDNASSFKGATVPDAEAETYVRPGDRLFRLPNGGLLLRRSVFADPCSAGTSRPNNSLAISHELARSLAFFGDTYQGGDASGAGWCRRTVPGTAGTIETPWDVSSKNDLERIKAVLGRIESVRSGKIPSDLQPAQHALAKELATAVPENELKAFGLDVGKRLEAFEGFGDLYLKHPILHTLGIAILFGLGTDIYHQTLGRLYKAVGNFLKKDPPEGGSGTTGGSGGSNTTEGSQNTSSGVSKREISEDGVISGEIKPGAGDDTVVTPLPDFVHNWDEEPTREWVVLPGVVTEDEGAMIYAPEYQAVVGGHFVALLPESGLQALAGPNANYTVQEFSNRVAELRGHANGDLTASYRALVGGNTAVNYGALGYSQSTSTALSGASTLAPSFRPTVVPLTLGNGTAPALRLPSIVVEPVLVPVR